MVGLRWFLGGPILLKKLCGWLAAVRDVLLMSWVNLIRRSVSDGEQDSGSEYRA